ncbi:MAG: hypothetical protein ABJA78_14985 [Ferruginibacter sp.]
MKKFIRYLLLVIILALVGGYIYWNNNKKKIIRQALEEAVKKKTDSLYYIHYDSSRIDEINGNASFYNVSLQSDSAQEQLLRSTDSLPNTLYSVTVKEVEATGIDVAGLLQNENVTAKKITLTKPRIQIIKTDADYNKPFTYDDTLALYKKLLGKFRSIKADSIEIVDGTVIMLTRQGKPLTTFENINISLNNFLVDSIHNYDNIVSYFIKNIKINVENIQFPEGAGHTRINIEKVNYDAAKKVLVINKVLQYKTNNTKPIIELNNIRIDSLNTDAFIMFQQLNAGTIACDGGLITVYKKTKSGPATSKKEIAFSSDLVVQAQAKNLKLGNTRVIVLDTSTQNAEPFILENVRFIANGLHVTDGNTIGNLINSTGWKLYSSGFVLSTRDKKYNLVAGAMELDNAMSSINIKQIMVKPFLGEEAFMKASKVQVDRFDLVFNNIQLRGVNFKRLISDNAIEVENASLQPIIKIYDDRTLPADAISKVGKYPHQMLVGLDIPVYVKTLHINDGLVSYREKELQTLEVGEVAFTHINATISNITNIDSRIKSNPSLLLDAKTLFLGKAKLTTQWDLSLNSNSGNFKIKGEMENLNALDINPISKPMALTAIKSGHISKLEFTENGTDTKASGMVNKFLYEDLKIEVLKKEDEQTKKKGLTSFLANFLILNNNPQNGKTRDAAMELERDIHRSFFNLVWKTLFKGVKNVTTGKN